MNLVKTAAAVLMMAAMMSAQNIPAGTALPVTLTSDVNAKTIQPGQVLLAKVAQSVPLPAAARIPFGSQVLGRVLQAQEIPGGGYRVRLKFDAITVNGRELPISTRLRAVASPVEVQNAGLPIHSPVAAETSATWTTVQIGGDDVYRGGGHVVHGDRVVGDPVADGVLAELIPAAPLGCAEGSGGRRLALWVFASSACGTYGFGKVSIERAGDREPFGEVVLWGQKNVHLRKGSAMLLIVNQTPPSQIQK